MTVSIVNEGQVSLNGKIYPITGKVKPQLLPRFVDRINTGANDYRNERILDNWIIKDQRGGIGLEETSVDTDRCWWTNLNTGFDGHMTLPPYATAVTPLAVPVITNADFELNANWTNVGGNTGRSTSVAHGGTYSWQVDATKSAYQDISVTVANFVGKKFGVGVWVYTTTAQGGIPSLAITDSVGTTTAIGGVADEWAFLECYRPVDASATGTTLRITISTAAGACWFDDMYTPSSTTPTPTVRPIEFNGCLYFPIDNSLQKLNSAGDGTTIVALFPKAITKLVSSIGNNLYICLGDDTPMCYMSTADAVSVTDVGDATSAVHWAGKLWHIDSAGQMDYCATPNTDSPNWTADANLADNGVLDGSIQDLVTDFNESGTVKIYAVTKDDYYLHDSTNAKFLGTGVKLSNHPNGGKGALRWNDGFYLPYGLGIKKYCPGATVNITEEGLEKDGGLPTEYAGEIMCLVNGGHDLIALVDASQVSGLGFSGVYGNDGSGWKCIWDCSLLDTWVYSFSSASGTGWGNLANAYDNSVSTYATSPSVTAGAWSAYATFVIAATNSHKLKFYATSNSVGTVNTIDIDVSTDGATWVDVYNGTFTADTWSDYDFALGAYINVRVRFYNNHATTAGIGWLKEIQLISSTCDSAIITGILSSVVGYRLWFNVGSVLYWISRSRHILNPKKISGYTYSSGGAYWSPWWAGGTKAFLKAIKRITEYCKDTSSTETVKLRYRLDHTYTNLYTGWTVLGTISSDGATATELASGAGISCESFQYMLELARTTTTTLSPDVEDVTVSYRRNSNAKQAYTFDVALTRDAARTPKQMISDLETAMAADIWLEFTFRDANVQSSKWVQIEAMPGFTGTGPDFDSTYTVTVVEV